MEAGGLIAEVGWTEFDFLSHGEESEVMAQLLGAFPSHGEEGHHELPWSDQASNAYSDNIGSSLAVPPAYEGYCFSDSNEALRISSCIASEDLNSVRSMVQPSLSTCSQTIPLIFMGMVMAAARIWMTQAFACSTQQVQPTRESTWLKNLMVKQE